LEQSEVQNPRKTVDQLRELFRLVEIWCQLHTHTLRSGNIKRSYRSVNYFMVTSKSGHITFAVLYHKTRIMEKKEGLKTVYLYFQLF